MDPERWQQVAEIFGTALDSPPGERQRIVAERCGDDELLRGEVMSLLESANSSADYFAELACRTGVPRQENADAERLVGRAIGNYRLLRVLGRGGMGVVFLAERHDEQFLKEVALKLLPFGVGAADGMQRFVRERQILAQLEHPCIARLLDGGVTEDGTLYYVMEYVDGLPIDQYCDENQLSIPSRLKLFVKVCEAVEHAHRHLVVHRDIKPRNVLVDNTGEVKLLDFGIARILDREGPAVDFTSTGLARPMTLAYASPEQVRGYPITTASDTYSLGILLYKLLTGFHPYRNEFESPSDAEQVICGEDPTLPSAKISTLTEDARAAVCDARATSAKRLQREFSGDLDTIVLMALRKEPSRRYASVGLLVEDIRRHEAGLPVRAHRDSLGYRLSRFLRRHRIPVAAVAAVVLLTFALLIVSVRYAITTATQQRALAQEAETTKQVSDFLLDMFKPTDPVEGFGDTVRARALLDQGIEQLTAGESSSPEVRARTITVLADVYGNLGLYDDAARLHAVALAIRRAMSDGPSVDLAESLEQLGLIYRDMREFDAALPVYEEALAIRRQLRGPPLSVAPTLQGLATTLRNLGFVDSAEVLIREAVEIQRRTLGDDNVQTLEALMELAYVLRADEQVDSAQALYEFVLPRLEAHGDSGARLKPAALNNLAYIHMSQGEFTEAERLYRDAIRVEREGGTVPNALMLMNNLAGVLDRQGKAAETEDVLRRRVEIAESYWPEGHRSVGSAYRGLALWNMSRGNRRAAEQQLRTALSIYRSTEGEESIWTVTGKFDLAACLVEGEQLDEAENLLVAAVEWLVANRGIENRFTQSAARRLVSLYDTLGRSGQAGRYRALLRSAGVPDTAVAG